MTEWWGGLLRFARNDGDGMECFASAARNDEVVG